ncbi:hypothetical protein ACFYTF_11605 [Nocardia thailandica]|uniref:Diacylglycerol O-acyltransferase n=1 Tax=Nocardia thailandica TaxID=257275 RepID=A0ABW6PM38_9NOCA
MDRLSVVDEIFLRTHRGLGTPIALQGLWRTAEPMDPAVLRAIHDRLRVGPLGRRVREPRVPGARRAWQRNTRAHPLSLAPGPVGDPLAWAATLGADLDPGRGPGWRLAAAPLADGGTLAALTCSHALADARGLIHAVDLALRDGPAGGDAPGGLGGGSDWADAAGQWATVLTGTARALRAGVPRPHRVPAPEVPGGRTTSAAVFAIAADAWDATATATGGTANSLFIHLVANMLWETGFPLGEIRASLPVDTRDEPRVDNDMAMTEIAVTRADTPATIRRAAREAYRRKMSGPDGLPEEILQVIPDRWAYALSRGAGERDILCSNIGELPASLDRVGPHRCTSVAARAIHPGLERFPRTRLSGYLSRIGDHYTLALAGLAADRVTLHTAAERAFAAAGLPARPW